MLNVGNNPLLKFLMVTWKEIRMAKNLQDNLMKYINASKVFLDKYAKTLVVTAALEFFVTIEIKCLIKEHTHVRFTNHGRIRIR